MGLTHDTLVTAPSRAHLPRCVQGWATMESVVGLGEEITEDEEAENFAHV